MDKNKEHILRDTKLLLKLEDGAEDKVLMLLVEDCISAVMSYCRLEVLPYQLTGLIARMAAKQYEREYLKSEGGGLDVLSITEGDREIEFSVPQSGGIADDYTERLKPFVNRRGRVPSDSSLEAVYDGE